MADPIKTKIISILSEQAMIDPDNIKLDATPEDLGLDSLNLVEIVFEIENCFNVSVPFNASEFVNSSFDITNVETIIASVKELVKGLESD